MFENYNKFVAGIKETYNEAKVLDREFENADNLALGLRTSALKVRGCTGEQKK